PRHVFDEEAMDRWAERRGVLVKAIEDTAVAVASVCRSLDVPLPERMPRVSSAVERRFADLVARIMPFDLVIDEETADGQEARVSKTSVCGSWGAVAGTVRYFADRFGVPRASIEGTQLPMSLVRKYATRGSPELVYDRHGSRDALLLRRRVTYFGFELEREDEVIDEFPPGLEDEARRVLAQALASGRARHPAVRRHAAAIAEVRELHRRSGGLTPPVTEVELTLMYQAALSEITSMREFRAAPLRIDVAALVPDNMRERFAQLPRAVEIRGKWIDI